MAFYTFRFVDYIYQFIELDYPLIIGCYDTVVKNRNSMQIRDLDFFYVQKGRLCAELTSKIFIMSEELYLRSRKADRKKSYYK